MNTFLVFVIRPLFPRKLFGTYWYWHFYLASNHWRNYRRRKIAQADAKCENCNRNNITLDVHHLTYKRLFFERLNDTKVLCRSCHKKEHSR
jgi:5-methylcytosine-specific restriction endonuclease McrA